MFRSVCLLTIAAIAIPAGRAAEANLVDQYIFAKMSRDGVPAAEPASDSEFLRRVYLDLTGRLPEPDAVRKFLSDRDPARRQKIIDSLIPALPVMGMRSVSQAPFLDRWTYFFCDLFRNGEVLEEGINTFYDYIYKSLTLNLPYDEFVRDMITASAVSTWTTGPANLIARSHVFEGDGYMMNFEDTDDEIAINTTRLFLGVDLECISCHNGQGHLEKINLWLAGRKRADVWRQASFFGKTFIGPVYGRSPQFQVKDGRKGYDLTSVSSLRPPRDRQADITPTFILDGGRTRSGESDRQAYARLITSDPQFSRATVNLFWAELMGRGIVDPPFGFDLARQDPNHPPPAPWTIQPSHPELLNALADDFRSHGYDLRRLIRVIVSSRAYQLSSRAPAGWKHAHDFYFARHIARRMSAEQLWDAVSQATGVFPAVNITFSAKKVQYLMQSHSPQDIDRTDHKLYKSVQIFGQCDRYAAEASRRPSMVQSAVLLNDPTLRDRVKVQKGSRLEALLGAENPKSNEQIVDEMFYAALSRPPSPEERKIGVDVLREYRAQGAEDLMWALVNRVEFLFY
jgi:hypothetical protein